MSAKDPGSRNANGQYRLMIEFAQKVFFATALVFSVVVCHGTARADWVPEFPLNQSTEFGPVTPLEVLLPANVSKDSLGNLAVELDGIDFTELIEYREHDQGTVLTIVPVLPLQPGEHELRLVEYTPAGEILERGYWVYGGHSTIES